MGRRAVRWQSLVAGGFLIELLGLELGLDAQLALQQVTHC